MLAFSLYKKKHPKKEAEKRAKELLRLFRLIASLSS